MITGEVLAGSGGIELSTTTTVITSLALLGISALSAAAAMSAARTSRFTLLAGVQGRLTSDSARRGRFLVRQREAVARGRINDSDDEGFTDWEDARKAWTLDLADAGGVITAGASPDEDYRVINLALGELQTAAVLVERGALDAKTFWELWAPTVRQGRRYTRTFIEHKRVLDETNDGWAALWRFLDTVDTEELPEWRDVKGQWPPRRRWLRRLASEHFILSATVIGALLVCVLVAIAAVE